MAGARTLERVFVREARRHLAVLADGRAPAERRHAAALAIAAAATPLGLPELDACTAALVQGRDEAEALVYLLRTVNELGARLDHDDAAPVLEEGFDADETRMLRRFFRDEAHEHLERIAHLLLRMAAGALDAGAIGELLRTTHTLKGSAATVGLAEVAEAAHLIEDKIAQLRSGRLAWTQATADALVLAVNILRALVDAIDSPGLAGDLAAGLREQLGALGRAPRTTDAVPLRREPPARGAPLAPADAPADAPAETASAADDRRLLTDRRTGELHVLRVNAARIDQLMDGVGELVFDRTRIERRMQELRTLVRDLSRSRQTLRELLAPASGATAAAPPPLLARLGELEVELAGQINQLARATSALIDDTDALRRTAAALQTGLTQVRMLPLRSLFTRLARPLRAIARAAGKRVELVTSGGDTEFDKTVAEQIADPLVQLLRNAVAHGIEPEHERLRLGKPAVGHIHIGARHEGDVVWLEVGDDGAGIDAAALRARFVESGHFTPAQAAAAGDDRILRAIFEAGVSTRDEADELAGRGVGLDAVRDTIARLGGDIQVASSLGRGTTFTIRLPLTTAISQALLFKIGGQVYAIPNVHVRETAYVEASSHVMPTHLRVREDTLSLVVLHTVLGVPVPADARRVPAVVIEYAGRRLAVTCDRVIGPREIVVKSLGPLLASLPLYAGGTISGSGKVQLILDVAALANLESPDSEPAAAPLPPAPSPPAAPLAGAAAAAGRVLLVNDSRTIRETLARVLSGAGFLVNTAEDGARAWEMLGHLPYDAMVTDLEMPHLDGLGLIERLRGAPPLRALPVIVISAKPTRSHRERAGALGVLTFLPKPVSRTALIDELRKILPAP